MEIIKVFIVDDERLARKELLRLLGQHDNVVIVGEASNGQAAIDTLQHLDVDIVFLDIQMPGLDGLQTSKSIRSKVVFCTAFSEHAIEAFELNALDYLLKPVDPFRLSQTLNRYIKNKEMDDKSNLPYLSDNHGLLLKLKDQYEIISLKLAFRFESVGNHVAVYFKTKKAYLHSSLTKIESRLDPTFYVKASRSDIIRVDVIERLEDDIQKGSMLAILNDGSEIPISRRQAQALKKKFTI